MKWTADMQKIACSSQNGRQVERNDYATGLFVLFVYAIDIDILKLSILKCFWYITCALAEPFSMSTNVLKSLNVCDLGPSLC
jgi:hypothetical protein